MNTFEWNSEQVEFLGKLVKTSYSASSIAQFFNQKYGSSITRNAVIGKCNRLGLVLAYGNKPKLKKTTAAPKKEPRRSKSEPKITIDVAKISASTGDILTKAQIDHLDKRYAHGKSKKAPLGRQLEIKGPTFVEKIIDHDKLELPATAVDFIGLENHHCRYPFGKEAPFMFCGDPTADFVLGRPYCAKHTSICFKGPRPASEREIA